MEPICIDNTLVRHPNPKVRHPSTIKVPQKYNELHNSSRLNILNLKKKNEMKTYLLFLLALLVAYVHAAQVSYNVTTVVSSDLSIEGAIYGPDGHIYYTVSDANTIYKIVDGESVKIAGNDTFGFSGDDGPATSAKLNYPMSPSFHANGDLYFVDCYNGRVRKVDHSTGVITTVAGKGADCTGSDEEGGPATDVCFAVMNGVYVKGDEFYVVDSDTNRIRKVDAEGKITTVIGSTGNFPTLNNVPVQKSAINLDEYTVCPNGDVYFTNVGNSSNVYYIRKVSN